MKLLFPFLLLALVTFTGAPPTPPAKVVHHSAAYLAWQAANPGQTPAPAQPLTNYNLSWGYYKFCQPPNRMRVVVFQSVDMRNWTIATNLPFGTTNAIFPGTNRRMFYQVGLFTQ